MVGVSTKAAPSPVAYTASFSIDMKTDKVDVTAYGDNNKTYVAGLPDDQGQYGGFADIAGDLLYTAARDGLSRKFYFYPDYVNSVGTYFFGSAFFDLSYSSAVGDAVKVSGTWVASTDISRVLAS
jgi:hypothetical protein